MSNTENDRIVGRIKKMLNLANDAAASEGERDNALRMAYATMAKHNIDMATAEGFNLNGKPKADEKREQVDAVYHGLHWTRTVSMAIAELFFCSYFYCKIGPSDARIKHSFVGRTANAVTASAMAEYIVESIRKEANKHSRNEYSPGRARRDFCKGAVERIIRRCYAMRREAEAASETAAPAATVAGLIGAAAPAAPGTALVLRNFYAVEKAANEQFVTAHVGKMRKGPSGRAASDFNSYRKGAEFGATVSLDRQVR